MAKEGPFSKGASFSSTKIRNPSSGSIFRARPTERKKDNSRGTSRKRRSKGKNFERTKRGWRVTRSARRPVYRIVSSLLERARVIPEIKDEPRKKLTRFIRLPLRASFVVNRSDFIKGSNTYGQKFSTSN